MRKLLYLFLLCSYSAAAQQGARSDSSFSFILMSDIHIRPDVAPKFRKMIDSVNRMKDIEFVVAAGDLVFDVMRGNRKQADSLYSLFQSMSREFKVPVRLAIGNHELFGIYPESPEGTSDTDYRYGMFERYFGKTYYSFRHKGWRFLVLNSIDVTPEKKYYAVIGQQQVDWIKKELQAMDTTAPIAIVTHIPLLGTYQQRYAEPNGPNAKEPNGVLVYNRKEVLDLFDRYNLRLVLQGHIHWIEDLQINNKTRFLTAGSVAGRPSWRGTSNGKRGFMKITIKGEKVSSEYISFD
jgi:Icc-related predicted phosphoesterase